MAECHSSDSNHHSCGGGSRFDWLLWGSLAIIAVSILADVSSVASANEHLKTFASSATELMSRMWWGVLMGLLFVGVLSQIPRDFVMGTLGKPGLPGLCRATLGGLMMDLCSHGILLVGMRLYERGASLGQVMAFLIASPWNSLSITFILFALIGFKWTMILIVLSVVIALVSGYIFEKLVAKGVLPDNPNSVEIDPNFKFWREAKKGLKNTKFNKELFRNMAVEGVAGSGMILRWVFFGVVLASLIRTFFEPDSFQTWFGATLSGLGLTIVAATIIEVCSEGSAPIAADLFTRAKAPGNGFAFLMTGVSTDYTEIMGLKETTKSWKIPLFLPLVTVPQIVAIAYILNQFNV